MNKLLLSFLSLSLLLTHVPVYAEAAPGAPGQGMWQTFIMIAIALAFFYLILWRPEQKRRKALEALRTELSQGDRVTAMGIIGTVLRVQEHTVILKMYDGAKVEFLKGAITEVAPAAEDASKESEASK